MKLSVSLSQSIVDRMMKQIPYNINMMNEHGVIIASGDPNRIGSRHIGAVSAIEQDKTIVLADDYGEAGNWGVNMPIRFDNEIIGVIGITGSPAEVSPFARLLVTATTLLLKQDQQSKREETRHTQLVRFLSSWLQTAEPTTDSFLKLEARTNQIDLEILRRVICLSGKAASNYQLDVNEFQLPFRPPSQLIIVQTKHGLNRLIKFAQENDCQIGIGSLTTNLQRSSTEARQTLYLQNLLSNSALKYYQQVQFTDELLQRRLVLPEMTTAFNQLEQLNDGELNHTLLAYFQLNGHIADTAQLLHIHRNTLTYRINQAKEITGYDFHDYHNLFQWYVVWLYHRADQKMQKSSESN